MKKIFYVRQCRIILMLNIILSVSSILSVRAQGFFTPTNHTNAAQNSRIEAVPEGYHIKSTYLAQPSNTPYYFGDLHLDNAGKILSWDSVAVAVLNNGTAYTWLKDDDLLNITPGTAGAAWGISKVHLNGGLVWSQAIPQQILADQHPFQVLQNESGEIFLLGHESDPESAGGAVNLLLYKFDLNGGLIWSIRQAMPDSASIAYSFLPTKNGGCVYSVSTNLPSGLSTYRLYSVSGSGQALWSDTVDNYVQFLQENSLGDLYTVGTSYDTVLSAPTAILERHAASGQLMWRKNLNAFYQKKYVSVLNLVAAADDGILVATQEEVDDNQFPQTFFVRFDAGGTLLWKKHYPFIGDDWGIHSGHLATTDNGFVMAGSMQVPAFQLFVLKIDANGNVYPGQISGRLAVDNNVNCLVDPVEQRVSNWKVQLANPAYALYTTTDSSGYYALQDVPAADYVLSALPSSTLWESCAGDIPISIPDTGALTIARDFPLQILAECPFMTVDIGTSLLRRCFSNNYTVHYCNEGAAPADSVYIQVTLNPLVHFNSASIPHTQIGDTLYFPIGPVPALACGDFSFNATVDCAAQLGQTLCVNARIFPDNICNPPNNWLGGLLEGSGACDGDSIHFQLRNIGNASTTAGLDFIVVDDHVIMLHELLPALQPGGNHPITVPANGTTWRLIAQQEPNAPGLEMPSVGVEGCGTGGTAPFGFMLQFPNRDGNPFTDRDCHEVIGSWDPNEKLAFPEGVGSAHFIEPNQPIDYQIRFQNTGTDTAFYVIVKDTLSPMLDPATIRPGAASYPYTWTLSGTGILSFIFNNILLPDSNTNEATSHGFIQFSIEQRKDLPLGTVVENRAGIYFDFNAPVITNTVFQTIGHDFLPTATREPAPVRDMLQAWPNPADQMTTIWADRPFRTGEQLLLRNTMGRVVREVPVQGQSIELRRGCLPAGLYFVEWRDARGVLGVGKVIWK